MPPRWTGGWGQFLDVSPGGLENRLFPATHSSQSRRHRGGLVGLDPQNKAPSPPKLKHETLYIGGILVNLIMSSPPRTNAKPPYWKLSGDGSDSAMDGCKGQDGWRFTRHQCSIHYKRSRAVHDAELLQPPSLGQNNYRLLYFPFLLSLVNI